jgi:hypothetical protein
MPRGALKKDENLRVLHFSRALAREVGIFDGTEPAFQAEGEISHPRNQREGDPSIGRKCAGFCDKVCRGPGRIRPGGFASQGRRTNASAATPAISDIQTEPLPKWGL